MRFEREIRIGAPTAAVWAFLWDVPRLAACVPGASDVRVTEDGKRYTAVISDRVGPFKVRSPSRSRSSRPRRPSACGPAPAGATARSTGWSRWTWT